MPKHANKILEANPIVASAPCRIDMGGTLDIATFYYPLRHLSPCTVNLALSMRTHVRLLPFRQGQIKISSKGFRSATFALERAPFSHPLGLMFAIGAFFRPKESMSKSIPDRRREVRSAGHRPPRLPWLRPCPNTNQGATVVRSSAGSRSR